jgi:hypothetical protein
VAQEESQAMEVPEATSRRAYTVKEGKQEEPSNNIELVLATDPKYRAH